MGDEHELVCGICLGEQGPGAEIGELDSCLHLFCFPCAHRWAAIENTCPFCKLRFTALRRKQLAGAEELAGADRITPLPGRYLDQQAVEERNQRVVFEDPDFQQWIETVACLVCGGGDDEDRLLLCDECDRACHTYCAHVEGIPEGDWFCPDCQEARAAVAAAAAGGWRARRRGQAQQQQPLRAVAGRQRAQQAGRRRGRGELQEDEDVVVDLLSSKEEEAEGQQRPAQRRRTGSAQQRQRAQQGARRRQGSGSGRADASRAAAGRDLDGLIVEESEEEDGDAEWGASRGSGSRGRDGGSRARQRPAVARASVQCSGRAGAGRRGQQLQLSDSSSEEELSNSAPAAALRGAAGSRARVAAPARAAAAGGQRRQRRQGTAVTAAVGGGSEEGEEEEEYPYGDSDEGSDGGASKGVESGSDEDLPLLSRLQARDNGIAAGSGRRGRSAAAGSARTAGAALQQALGASRRPAAAAVGGTGLASGPTEAHRRVDELRRSWETLRTGAASFPAAPAAAGVASRGRRLQQRAAAGAGSGGACRRRLVRVGELQQAATAQAGAGASLGGIERDLGSDPTRQRAVAALRAQQAQQTSAAAGPPSQPEPVVMDLTSPSPVGVRPGEGVADEEMAWRARGAALLERQSQQQQSKRSRLDSGLSSHEDAYLNQSLTAARLRQQLAACREVGRQLLPRRHARDAAAAGVVAGAAGVVAGAARHVGSRSPTEAGRGPAGAQRAVPNSASPMSPGGRRHARSVGDYVFAANVARGTPGGASRAAAAAAAARGGARGPGGPFIIPRRVPGQIGEHGEATTEAHHSPAPQRQERQSPQQQQPLLIDEEGEERGEAENSRPRSGHRLSWPWQQQPQKQPTQQIQQQQPSPSKAPAESQPANPFSRFSLQPSNRGGSGSGSQQPPQQASARPPSLAPIAAAAAVPVRGTAALPHSSGQHPPQPSQGPGQQHHHQQREQGTNLASTSSPRAGAPSPAQQAAPPANSSAADTRPAPSLPRLAAAQPCSAPPTKSPHFPSEEWPGWGQPPPDRVPPESVLGATPRQQQATPPSTAGPGLGLELGPVEGPVLIIPSSTPPASKGQPPGRCPEALTWPSASLDVSVLSSGGRGGGRRPCSGSGAGAQSGQGECGGAGAAAAGGGERPSKQAVYERVKVHLKAQYLQRQISKEQYKQVAREATHQLFSRGTLEDAEVEAAVRQELSKLL